MAFSAGRPKRQSAYGAVRVGDGGHAASKDTDNNERAVEAKIKLRRNVLELVQPARVFDAFCGFDGEMYRSVWCEADEYVGVDMRWRIDDPRPRFVADNRRVMRAIDLGAYNVFDIDAYGSPWEQLTILAARRRWSTGERGAVVITDGSSIKLRTGGVLGAMARICGLAGTRVPASNVSADALQTIAIGAWLKVANVRALRRWQAKSGGRSQMLYTAVVFEGL